MMHGEPNIKFTFLCIVKETEIHFLEISMSCKDKIIPVQNTKVYRGSRSTTPVILSLSTSLDIYKF